MWDLLFRGLVLRLIVMFCVGVAMALLLLAITPIILLVAAFIAQRRAASFRLTVGDMYSTIWDMFCDVIRAPFTRGT